MVADIAAAFVLLVAGGCARVLWREALSLVRAFDRWATIHIGGVQECHLNFRDEHEWVKAAMEDVDREAKHYFYKQYAGTKNAGKVLVEEECFAGLVEQRKRVEPQADYIREAEQRGDEEEARRRLAQVRAGKVPGVTSAQREVAEAEARRLRKIEKWERRLQEAEEALTRERLKEDERTRKWAQMKGCGAL